MPPGGMIVVAARRVKAETRHAETEPWALAERDRGGEPSRRCDCTQVEKGPAPPAAGTVLMNQLPLQDHEVLGPGDL